MDRDIPARQINRQSHRQTYRQTDNYRGRHVDRQAEQKMRWKCKSEKSALRADGKYTVSDNNIHAARINV
jgi:hypothetical protein